MKGHGTSNIEPLAVWIDVGGTFTDCFIRDSTGRLRAHKTLSSGKVLLACEVVASDPIVLSAAALRQDPARFWEGARVELIDATGRLWQAHRVVSFAEGRLTLAPGAELPPRWTGRAALDAGLEAPVLAVRRLLGVPLSDPLPPLHVRLGTTKGTNALLTRSGAKTALAITAPLGDLPRIGDQTRPHLFDLTARKLPPIAVQTVEITERLDASGNVIVPLDMEDAARKFRRLLDAGIESLAICLLHAYLNGEHEQQLAELARRLGFPHVSTSHQVAPLIEIVPRAHTTAVDAYIGPVIRHYLQLLHRQFGFEQNDAPFYIMTSAGGLVRWDRYWGKDSILSGPAGGVAALASIREALAGVSSTETAGVIGLDMGGTSTDVSKVGQRIELQLESTKAGIALMVPTLPIETVAAGGGSICWFDGVSLRVGPDSAGADPGPACYGKGGPLTITDLNVYTGRIPQEQFPFPVDRPAIERRLQELCRQVGGKLGPVEPAELAEGFRRIANEQMAGAVRTVTLAQGVDPRQFALVGFGGAAGQHICEVAELLQIQQVIDVPQAGLLSALGMGYAPLQLVEVLPVYQESSRWDAATCWQEAQVVAERLRTELLGQRPPGTAATVSTQIAVDMRYAGTDTSLTIPWTEGAPLVSDFHDAFFQRYGYRPPRTVVEIVAVRIVSTLPSDERFPAQSRLARRLLPSTSGGIRRSQLRPGDVVIGPAVIGNEGSTLVVPESWEAECLDGGALRMSRRDAPPSMASIDHHEQHSPPGAAEVCLSPAAEPALNAPTATDPVLRECFGARIAAIAAQMGTVLQQTAISVNVKQRRDFSCAIFDRDGTLLANAPHVPVHLGAMGETVREILRAFPDLQPGDAVVTNDPYRGGSHLPDITVVSPVFDDQGQRALLVANRAHHADVGGITPGSMGFNSRRLADEGVLIEPRMLVRGGTAQFESMRALLSRAPYPPRNLDELLADLAAQVAANRRGAELIAEYATQFGWQNIARYAAELLEAAADRIDQLVRRQLVGKYSFQDWLDHGIPIAVTLEGTEDGRLRIDFSGSGPVDVGSFNANPSIVRAAVLYVLRCLMADDFPLNEGVMQRIDLHIPEGILNPPRGATAADSPPVAAGNVETSQRVVDVLLGALGVAAASQGTMNNVLFGTESFGFYETICGGAGATSWADGESGVHTHMTNTRLTDPEVLEARYPVRLVDFRLRPGSGGRGRFRGGEGVLREIEFLTEVNVTLLTSRRNPQWPPFALAGGEPGAIGENWLVRPDQPPQRLPASGQFVARAGDRLRILTPGGGGYGSPQDRTESGRGQ
ncbi:MAG: 5-oxoprolinase [Pirellulaceae bacterium]|nr:MAG: 5-oxoprolinase [Pirellulaceae bacterium]